MIFSWIRRIASLIWMFPVFLPFITKEPQNSACLYWVAPAPAGNDHNPGTYDKPWATLEGASESVPDNYCTVWFKSGAYTGENRLNRRFTTRTLFRSLSPYQAVLTYSGTVVSISGGKNIILDGFDIHHSGPGAAPLVVAIDRNDDGWAEMITLRNNLIHDSFNNDLLKIYNGARQITVQNNVFYNQGDGEEHMDVNSVTDVVIEDNIFFNSFESSGRTNLNQTKQFIVIKDSNGSDDGLLGSRRVTVRQNLFFNWQGQNDETFIQVGLDGKPYHEAVGVRVENNLLVGNSPHQVGKAFGVRGAKDVEFVNNTVVGDLPSDAYAAWVTITELNPFNENISFRNNIWSDSTGTMGAGLTDSSNTFAEGVRAFTIGLVLDTNLYWNGSKPIPPGDLFSPLVDDTHRVVASPQINETYAAIELPVWSGSSFPSGSTSIRDEFTRLVRLFGTIPSTSPAVGEADPAYAPLDDILGRSRTSAPDLGAFEAIGEIGL